jgi:hypothetical protein
MLPTNPQSLNAADRAVLDNLKQQGEQIDRQTKVLETLIDRVTRQMRSDEKLEKNDKKNQIKGDTEVRDIPGIAFNKISDKFNDFIVNRFNSIKDMFKENKSKPTDKSKEPPLKDKDKKSKDEDDVLKNILSNMVSASKYQEQMLEHTKAIQAIADKTFVSINDLKDNLQNAEQPENNITPKSNEIIPEKKENNKVKSNKEKQTPALFLPKDKIEANNEISFNDKKLPDSIGAAVGKSLKPQLDVLGKTFKTSLEEGFSQLDDSILNLKGIGLPSVIPTPPVLAPAAAALPAAAAAGTAAGSALGAASVVGGVVAGGAALSYGAANYLSKLDNQSLETLSNSGGGDDTAIASAIQLQGNKGEERKAERIQNPTQSQIREIDNALAKKEKPDKLGFGPGMKAPITAEDYKRLAAQKLQKNTLQNAETPNSASTINNTLNSAPPDVTQKKRESSSLMKAVTDERAELSTNNKAGAPVIINNTNNSVSESGSSVGFASARSTDLNDSVRDYKRNNARLFDAA